MNNFRISPDDVTDVLNNTSKIIKIFGPRLPGSKACIQAVGYLKSEYGKYCDKVFDDKFILHPGAFFYLPHILVFSYLSGLLFSFIPALKLLSFISYLTGLIYFTAQFVFFRKPFDKLFTSKPGMNVTGIIEPACELKQQIIISSHHDSPFICNFLNKYQKLFAFRLFAPIIFYLVAFIISCIALAPVKLIEVTPGSVYAIIIYSGCIAVIPMLRINRKEGSPGAGDNILSSIIGIKIAEIIRKNFYSLNHTRLIFLSNDGEEIGMRGAQAFIHNNKDLIDECKTYVFNMDSLYKLEDLSILTSDRNGTIKLSESLAGKICSLAEQLNYIVPMKKFPFGGGGTDAAFFAAAGIETVSLIGISTDLIRDGLIYHTANDLPENLDPRAIEAALNITLNFILNNEMNCR